MAKGSTRGRRTADKMSAPPPISQHGLNCLIILHNYYVLFVYFRGQLLAVNGYNTENNYSRKRRQHKAFIVVVSSEDERLEYHRIMPEKPTDDALARYVTQTGMATTDQIEKARARTDTRVSLGDVLVSQGVITKAQRESVEKVLHAKEQGGIQQLGNYKLLKKIGEGGMGAVFLAEDTVARRKVALKVLPKKFATDPGFVARFRREAKAMGKLNHANIVAAYAVGEELGHHYYAMEYSDGESLDKRLKREKVIGPSQALEIITQVALGLKHAHDHGVIHRDIKPANIFITTPGVAKILDLGLSKNLLDSEQSFNTQTGISIGTPHYIAPEQARGDKNIDGRADIYSLGVTFYHIVTGQTPFHGSTAAVIMTKHLTEQLPNPKDIRADIPDGIVHVIRRMMAKSQDDRYDNCDELLDDLVLISQGETPSSKELDALASNVALPSVRVGTGSVRRSGRHGLVDQRHQTSATETSKYRALLIGAGTALILICIAILALNPPKKQSIPLEAGTEIPVDTPVQGAQTLPATGSTSPSSRPQPGPPLVPPDEPWMHPGPVDEAFIKGVRALTSDNQIKHINIKMKEFNPGFVEIENYGINKGNVNSIDMDISVVRDISPLPALSYLQRFNCTNKSGKGVLFDLKPLTGMKLTTISVSRSRIKDLSPLKGMPLSQLDISETDVVDLSPLSGMQFRVLNIKNTQVSDISLLKGSTIERFIAEGTQIKNLLPLANMRMQELNLNHTAVTDITPLKNMPLTVLALSDTAVSDLSPLKGMQLTTLQINGTRVTSLSALKGMPLVSFSMDKTVIDDLSPLKGMPLRTFSCNTTPVSDLSPLKEMALTFLSCEKTAVSDLSPLRGMRLDKLIIYGINTNNLSPIERQPLTEISLNYKPERDAEVLRRLSTLRRINNMPCDAFWLQQKSSQKKTPP